MINNSSNCSGHLFLYIFSVQLNNCDLLNESSLCNLSKESSLTSRRLMCSFFVLSNSDPVYEDMLSESRKMITNEKIDAYNEAAVRILNSSSRNSKAKVKVFSVSKLIAQETIMKSADGLHLPESSRDTVSVFITGQH